MSRKVKSLAAVSEVSSGVRLGLTHLHCPHCFLTERGTHFNRTTTKNSDKNPGTGMVSNYGLQCPDCSIKRSTWRSPCANHKGVWKSGGTAPLNHNIDIRLGVLQTSRPSHYAEKIPDNHRRGGWLGVGATPHALAQKSASCSCREPKRNFKSCYWCLVTVVTKTAWLVILRMKDVLSSHATTGAREGSSRTSVLNVDLLPLKTKVIKFKRCWLNNTWLH